jgi:hypothetical protein
MARQDHDKPTEDANAAHAARPGADERDATAAVLDADEAIFAAADETVPPLGGDDAETKAGLDDPHGGEDMESQLAESHGHDDHGDHDHAHGDHETLADRESMAAQTASLAPAAPVEIPAPPRNKGLVGRFSLLLAVLGLVATGGGLAAIKFKDRDPRLGAVADYIETAARDPRAALLSLEQQAETLLAWNKPPRDANPPPAPALEAPAAKEPVAMPPADDGGAPAARQPKPGADWAAPSEPANNESAAAPAPVSPPASGTPRDEEIQALLKRVEQLEEAVRKAPRTAEEGTYLNALEGRIDELAVEIKAVRERLDQPKAETRLPSEPADVRGGGTKKAATADIVVIAQTLLRQLERGKPYAHEQAALTALGADPALLATLAPAAEAGAPTSAQLLQTFTPVARRLRALDAPKTGAPFADQLLAEASKLVKVRPSNRPAAETVSDIVVVMETALAHDNAGAAAAAFARLPEAARTEAQSFGEVLNRRRDVEKAAEALLSGAIAALGQVND